jgi:two-component sensor histidine kinase
MGQGMDLLARRKDGTEFAVEISLCYLPGDHGGLSMAFISDITTRKRADKEREEMILSLNGALSEKTVLLQEVHHRVKNNLAVIAALLGMQAKMLEDERAKISLGESRQRVLSMARIHEFLYATEHLDRVAFGKYVAQLSKELSASYSIASDLIAIRIHADDIDLPVHQAIPCGLILNELLSNALKYAFPGGRTGKILVRFIRLESGALSLSCTDDGIGIPESFNWQNSTSLGLRIMSILTKQIDGELTLDRNGRGTRFELKFPCAELNVQRSPQHQLQTG